MCVLWNALQAVSEHLHVQSATKTTTTERSFCRLRLGGLQSKSAFRSLKRVQKKTKTSKRFVGCILAC